MYHVYRHRSVSLRQKSSFVSTKDDNGNNNDYLDKKISVIDEINSEVERNMQRLIGIRQRSELEILSNTCLTTEIERNKKRLLLIRERCKPRPEKSIIPKAGITPFSSEFPMQTKNSASDSLLHNKQEQDRDSEVDDFKGRLQPTTSIDLVESLSEISMHTTHIFGKMQSINEDCNECDLDRMPMEHVPTCINLKSLPAKKVCKQTQATITQVVNAYPHEIPEHLHLGLTLPNIEKLLIKMSQDAVKVCNDRMHTNIDGMPKFPQMDLVNGYVNRQCTIYWCDIDGMSVCERLMNDPDMAAGVGKANVFVSWDLSNGTQTLVDGLREFLDIEKLPKDSTFFWIRDYVVRQSSIASDMKWLGDCVKKVGFTVLLSCDNLLPMKRAQCIQELYHTKISNSKFSIISKERNNNFERTVRLISAYVVESISNINLAEAEYQNAEEKKLILDDLEHKTSPFQCNMQVIELLQEELTNQGLKALSKVYKPGYKASILIDNIAILLKKQERYEEAQELFEERLLECCLIDGTKNQETLSSMYKLANFLREQGNFNKARNLLNETLAGQREIVGSVHEDTLTSMATLALLLSQLELFDDAIPLYKEVLAGRQVLGSKIPVLGSKIPCRFTR